MADLYRDSGSIDDAWISWPERPQPTEPDPCAPDERYPAWVQYAQDMSRSNPLPAGAAELGIGYWPHWDHTPLSRRSGVTGLRWVPLTLTPGYLHDRCPCCRRLRKWSPAGRGVWLTIRWGAWRHRWHVRRCSGQAVRGGS